MEYTWINLGVQHFEPETGVSQHNDEIQARLNDLTWDLGIAVDKAKEEHDKQEAHCVDEYQLWFLRDALEVAVMQLLHEHDEKEADLIYEMEAISYHHQIEQYVEEEREDVALAIATVPSTTKQRKPQTYRLGTNPKEISPTANLADAKAGNWLQNCGAIYMSENGWVELRCVHCGGNCSMQSSAPKRNKVVKARAPGGWKSKYVSGLLGMSIHMRIAHQDKTDVLTRCTVRTLTHPEVEAIRAFPGPDPIPRVTLVMG